jgi:hypothetical protein
MLGGEGQWAGLASWRQDFQFLVGSACLSLQASEATGSDCEAGWVRRGRSAFPEGPGSLTPSSVITHGDIDVWNLLGQQDLDLPVKPLSSCGISQMSGVLLQN